MSGSMSSIAVVLPAYNEELTIADTILDFHRELPDAMIIVVNNASSDDTAVVARRTITESSVNGMVIDEPRAGKANAVRIGLRAFNADIYIMADADLTYPAKHVHELIKPIKEGMADMVVGDRLSHGRYREENKRQFHNLGNNLVCTLVNKLFKADLKDIMSGYRAFSRRFTQNYPILVEGFQLETDMTLHALDKRFRIVEIPVEYRDRPAGSSSKLHTFRDGARVLTTILDIFRHYRPLLFFGMIAFLLLVSALGFSVPVMNDWIRHKYIYHVPLAILSSALVLLSTLAMSVGLILDSIAYQHRMDYEQNINKQLNEEP
jgi:glycosyltransferase involved in cell wall biosynthesis